MMQIFLLVAAGAVLGWIAMGFHVRRRFIVFPRRRFLKNHIVDLGTTIERR